MLQDLRAMIREVFSGSGFSFFFLGGGGGGEGLLGFRVLVLPRPVGSSSARFRDASAA